MTICSTHTHSQTNIQPDTYTHTQPGDATILYIPTSYQSSTSGANDE